MDVPKGNIFDLEAEVIYNDMCCYCGACGAFCQEYIRFNDEMPTTEEKCYEIHGACYDFCPRTYYATLDMDRKIFGKDRKDNDLGSYEDIVTSKVEDGDTVATLLITALEKGIIDAAVIAKSIDKKKSEPIVATTKEEILECVGAKYLQCPSILGVREALDSGYENIAFVGLPCHIQALRKIQTSTNFDVGADKVKLVIGTFCKAAVRAGCKVCCDFTAEHTDLSLGTRGSESGWTTIIVRTDEGKKVLKAAEKKGLIETESLPEKKIASIQKFALKKKKDNLDNIFDRMGQIKLLNLVFEGEELKSMF